MKLALVTAGMRRIGAAIAARLASEGWALALHSRREDMPAPELAAVLAQDHCIWHSFVADFGDSAAVAALLPAVAAHFGRLPDLIVNNASRFVWDDPASVTAEARASPRGQCQRAGDADDRPCSGNARGRAGLCRQHP
jgi:pteridine reductase